MGPPDDRVALAVAFFEPGPVEDGDSSAPVKLQKPGAIEYSRGRITVPDRPMLEQLSCECYAAAKKEADRIASLTVIPGV